MIQKIFADNEYHLVCDMCGETETGFESFQDAVEFKKDRDNRWRAVKNSSGEWHDLCPECNTPDIISQIINSA